MAALGLIAFATTLEWAGRKVTQDLAPYVKSISYTDSLETGKSTRDQVSLVLDNRNRIFLDAWFPAQGDTLRPGVVWTPKQGVAAQTSQQSTPQAKSWAWGAFDIDSIRFRFTPDEVVIGALATSPRRSEMEQARSRAFTDIKLSALVNQLAGEARMTAYFAGDDVQISRLEQRAESNRDLLGRLGERYGLPVSQKNQSLFMGIPELPELSISLANRDVVTQADFPITKRSTYSAVVIDYYDTEQKANVTYRAGDSGASEGRTVRLYDVQVSNMDEAKRYADAQLSGAGKGRQHAYASVQLINTPVAAGQIINITDAGQLPKRWRVVNHTTSLSASWVCNAKLEKIS